MKPNLQMSIALCLAAGYAGAQTPAGDAAAVAMLTAVNQHEIATAKLAAGKEVAPAVLQYAKMLQSEHQANQRKLEQLAGDAGVTPADTPKVAALKQKTEAERRTLAQLDGPAFQTAYVEAMVKDHAEALATIDEELLPAARNADVAAHLRETRAHIAKHLEQARSLSAEVASDD